MIHHLTSTFRFNLVNRNHIRYLLTLRTWRSSREIRPPPNDHVVMTTPTQRLHGAQQLYDNWFLGLWRASARLWAKRLVLPPSLKRFYRTYLLFLTGYYYKFLRRIVKSEYKCWVASARRNRGPLIDQSYRKFIIYRWFFIKELIFNECFTGGNNGPTCYSFVAGLVVWPSPSVVIVCSAVTSPRS